MQLFYNPDVTNDSSTLSFDREESRHIVKVMRKNNGDNLFVTNGKGSLYKTEIVVAAESKCQVKIISSEQSEPMKYQLHLAVAPTKMNDRFEWFLEKATEIGVTEITPLICDRSERRSVKTERFHKIVQSAMKQSMQTFLPKLNEPVDFSSFVGVNRSDQTFIAHCEDGDRKSLKELAKTHSDITILIGPEGDFTTKEIKLALEHNFEAVTLGNTRLRTETAAIVACHSIAFINES